MSKFRQNNSSLVPTVRDYAILAVGLDQARTSNHTQALVENDWPVWQVDGVEPALLFLLQHQPMAAIVDTAALAEKSAALIAGMRRMAPATAFLLLPTDQPQGVAISEFADLYEAFLPLDEEPSAWVLAVRRAVELKRTIRRELDFLTAADGGLVSRLEWFLWKHRVIQKDRGMAHGKLIRNLKHSLSQGLGPGALLTMVEMLPFLAKKEGQHYVVPEKAIDDLCMTADRSFGWFEKMDGLMGAFERSCEPVLIDHTELRQIVEKAVAAVEPLRAIKNQRVGLEVPACEFLVRCDPESLSIALRELLVNAFKYSPDDSAVELTGVASGGRLKLMLFNDVLPMTGGVCGIPAHLENAVFEPFSRLNNVYDERFRDEEFGMGTGLTVVEAALFQMGAQIQLGEVLDHSKEGRPVRRVLASVSLPCEPPQVHN